MNECRLLDEPIIAHPDREPHRKACAVCAFRKDDPQGIDDATWERFAFEADMLNADFYCVHRTVDGFHRLCACFAAAYGIKRARAGFEDG